MEHASPRRIRHLEYVVASVVAVLSALGLVGWFGGLPEPAGKIATYGFMGPVASLTFILLCAALAIRVRNAEGTRTALTVVLAAVALLATLGLVDLLTGLPVAADRLFAGTAGMAIGRQPGRMSPILAINFVTLAIAVLFSSRPGLSARRVSAALSLIVANAGLLLCVGYAYDMPLFNWMIPRPPTLPAALGLTILGLATAGLTMDRAPGVFFVGDSVSAQLMRAVLPTVVGTTIVLVGSDAVSHRFGLGESPVVSTLLFVLTIGLASTSVMRSASRIGLQVDRSEQALAGSNAALEHMVHDVAATMGRVVEARDPYTQGHEQRVAALAGLLAREIGQPDDEVDGVVMAGLLHDVGKLRVPAEILTKPGRLSNAELALIAEHPQAGYDILQGIKFPWETAETVLQHHERMDGSGYPRGLAGDEILMAARILAVADVIEAMTYDRPYRPALGLAAAAEEIAAHPECYDAGVLAACAALYAEGRLIV